MKAIVFIILQTFFCNAQIFENWGIFLDIPQFRLGNICARDLFRPIAHERKYLMAYNDRYCFYLRKIYKIMIWKSKKKIDLLVFHSILAI